MPSESQLAANRANSQLSTGPVTDAGKFAIRSNSLKHGFYAHSAVLEDYESAAEFGDLHSDCFDHLAPAGPIELELAARLVLALWQLRRLQTAESQALGFALITARDYVAKRYTNCNHWVLGYAIDSDIARNHPRLEAFARHRARWERTYYRALHELERLQLARRGHAVPPPQVLEIHAPSTDDASSRRLFPSPRLPPAPLPRHPNPRLTLSAPCPNARPRPARLLSHDRLRAVTCQRADHPASHVSEPRPSASGCSSTPPPSPAKPTPTPSSQTTKPPIGFVSQKPADTPPPPRPSHPRKS